MNISKTLAENKVNVYKTHKVTEFQKKALHSDKVYGASFDDRMNEAVAKGKADSRISGDFFITVEFRQIPGHGRLPHMAFVIRRTCPTPCTGFTVYRFIRDEDRVELLWTLPGKTACNLLMETKSKLTSADKELGYLHTTVSRRNPIQKDEAL